MAETVTPPKMVCTKALAESPGLTSLPSCYTFTQNPQDHQAVSNPETDDSIPIIDFSLLHATNPDQRSKAIEDLGKACKEWGFFMLINHGVEEKLLQEMLDACKSFFDLTEEEKKEFSDKHVLDPIRCGTSFNASVEKIFFWRDFLEIYVHPHFHSPNKPSNFSDISSEYCKRTREVARELLRGISESLGLESSYMDENLNLDSGFQMLTANLYPPCPQPELAMGLPPHSDQGLLNLLTQNGIGGLQVLHNGKWVNVNAIPNSFLVNICDHIEILSNGKYKSIVHRAIVNNKTTRISLVIGHGPSLDTVVVPAKELIESENATAAYVGMKYKEYFELHQSNALNYNSFLDRVRIN